MSGVEEGGCRVLPRGRVSEVRELRCVLRREGVGAVGGGRLSPSVGGARAGQSAFLEWRVCDGAREVFGVNTARLPGERKKAASGA